MRRWADERGQTAVEYVGVIVVVAALIVAFAAAVPSVGSQLSCRIGQAVSALGAGDGGGGCSGGGGQTAGGGAGSSGAAPGAPGGPAAPDASRDTDGDGIDDAEEASLGLDGRRADSDGDGVADGDELAAGTDPLASDAGPSISGRSATAVKGFVCGDSAALLCGLVGDGDRGSLEYLLGQTLSGVAVVGDVRDGLTQLFRGNLGEASLAAVGLVPAVGDAGKAVGNTVRWLRRYPERAAEAVPFLIRKFGADSAFSRQLLRQLDRGSFDALVRGGMSETDVARLAERGNDLRRIAQNATVRRLPLDDAARADLDRAVRDPVWAGRTPGEAYGVESALRSLRQDPNIEVLLDGRPRAGRANTGADIVAVDRTTGRTIVVEAKGTGSGTGRPLGAGTVRSRIDGVNYTQPSRAWLEAGDRSKGTIDNLLRSPDAGEREAGRRLQEIVDDGAPYDPWIVNSRPANGRDYGTGLDDVAEGLKRSSGGDVTIIDAPR